jgi:hypothetical protein
MRGVIPGAMPGMLAWQFLFRLIQGIRKQFDARRAPTGARRTGGSMIAESLWRIDLKSDALINLIEVSDLLEKGQSNSRLACVRMKTNRGPFKHVMRIWRFS